MKIADLPARNLRLVDVAEPNGARSRPWLLVHSIRTGFLISILVVSVLYQIQLGNFLNVEIWLPVYAILLANFALNSIYLLLFERLGHQTIWNGVLFGLDVMAITLLIDFTGTGQSLFLFLYLVNLILAGLIFDQDGAWLLTIWTSICFSGLLLVSPEISGQNLYFSLTVNNLAFVAVTYLSGRLSEQLNVVGSQLRVATTDLAALQNLNELIVNHITTGLIVLSPNEFVQFFNTSVAGILGVDQIGQLKIQDVLPELGWPWKSLVEDQSRDLERREVRLERAGAETKVLEVVATRFSDPDGRERGWLLLVDDRTEQKQIEETLRQKEKLAAVGQLAAGIAHEIRNPLASISGSIQLMMGNPQVHSEEDLKLMKIVDKEIDRLNGLITEFLDYVRPEKKVTLAVNLNNLVREVVESTQFNPKLRKDVKVEFELRCQCEILGSRDKLKQALLNFTLNAFQAMEKTENPVFKVCTFDQRETVVLTLSDNGSGIKPENIHRIFEPFHTTKAQGTGLGLAVTHKILEAHEATVHVESVLNEGTKFTVEFPAHRDFHTEDLIPFKQQRNG